MHTYFNYDILIIIAGDGMSNIYLTGCALAISILLSIMFFLKKRVDNIETKIFGYMLLLNIIESISTTSIVVVAISLNSDFFLTILNRIDIIAIITWTSLMFYYVLNISHKSFCQTFKKFIIILNVLLYTLALILPVNIINQDGILDSNGPLTVFGLGAAVIYIIFMAITVISVSTNKRKDNNIKYIPLYFLIVLLIIIAILRVVVPEINFISILLSFVVFLMYHTIENPDIRMIAALNEAKLAAEKANNAKSDFLSSMSHEIRTPLNAIVGFSDCILEEETLEAAKSDAKDIKLASENLLEIVNGILDISKIEADKMEIVETDYNILEALDNVAKLVKPRIGDKPIEMNVNFAPDIPYIVHGDGGKLRQIITNILTNAVKYTEEGSIYFDVSCVNEGDETKLILSVEDTGRGIKPEQIDKLFTKFQRLDEDKNTTLEGTGLGLAITKRFVEMMGGKIVVQSKYGSGSKFTVYLRQKIVTLNKPESEKEEELFDTMQIKLFDFSKCRVLVVDDNKVNIKVALKILSNYGITADSCESGFDVIDRIKSGSIYDLILLDDMMPRMSGVETLKQIKELVSYDMTVVALTANALSGMKEKYINDGFDDYLAKPIEKNELYRILITYLNNKMQKPEEKSVSVNMYTVKEENKQKEDIKKSILIVDDNKINIKIVEKLLSNFDLDIDSALSGKEAIEKVKNKNYDLVFMDIMMPEMDGVEAFHHLRDDLGFKNPVITLTADAVAGSKEKYLNEGFNDYLAKPITLKIISDIIKKYL